MSSVDVPQALIEQFADDGVVCVRNVLNADEVAAARAAIERVLADPSPLAQVASASDDPGSFFEDFCRWGDIAAIEELVGRE